MPEDANRKEGSSPRMRGTLMLVSGQTAHAGIIPAYAGNTIRSHGTSPTTGDHPRVCGEHQSSDRRQSGLRGSSPRMRGTRQVEDRSPIRQGIIPAYAGNTLRDYSNFVVSKFMSFVFHLV